MPLVTMFSVSDGDVNSNPNCIFIYADHRKQSGRPFINNRFRKMDRAFPLILKKYGGHDPAAYWKDSEMEVFLSEFEPSLDKISNLMRRRYIGILCTESLYDDEFNPLTLKDYSVKIYEHVSAKLAEFHSRFEPDKLKAV